MRTILSALLAAILALPASAGSLPSNDEILTHIRETTALPAEVPLALSAPKASGVPGLQKATLTLGKGERSQEREVYFSQDGRHYFMAEMNDLSTEPDKERRSKIKLEGSPSKGPKNAPVTIVEFSDFQCPFCRRAHLAMKNNIKEFEGKVRFVFKQFPLIHIHQWAQPAALASACAFRQKEPAFWTFADRLFEDQKQINKENIRAKALELAAEAKLDVPAFTKCFDKKEPLDKIKRDVEEATDVGVSSTPTFFVNGHPMRGYRSFKPFRNLIEEILEGKHP